MGPSRDPWADATASGPGSPPAEARIEAQIETQVHPDRWEHGSVFHLSLELGDPSYPWAGQPHSYWGSGRDALRALLAWGRATHSWTAVLCPSFYCPEAVVAIRQEANVKVYPDAPTMPDGRVLASGSGDAALTVSLYGRRPAPRVDGAAIVVEDHSHDPISPWAHASQAQYAVASLRKTLPLPDGGVVWSPRGLDVPPERGMTDAHEAATLDRLSAMILKRHYLSGSKIAKDDFRTLAVRGEARFADREISGMSPFSRSRMDTFPAEAWRSAREANLAAFRAALGELPGVTLLDAPFAATLVFDDPLRRDEVRRALIEARIYPAILWSLDNPPVEGIPADHVQLGRRVLSLACDQRYGPGDMIRVATQVQQAVGRR